MGRARTRQSQIAARGQIGKRQDGLGLHHLPVSHCGLVAWVFEQQRPCLDDYVEDDAFELVALRDDLAIRFTRAVPFALSAARRGVIVARSPAADHDLELLQFVASPATPSEGEAGAC